ncbi:hypothetical protein BZL70_29905 [Escherichia coli]|nr:hypothetical protein BZL70_29905 [Escherichia coli]
MLVETCPVPMRRVGVKERYGQVGTQDFLQREYGLTAQDCRIRSVWLCRFTVRTDRRMYPLSQYW